MGESYDRHHYYLGDGAYWCEADLDDFIEQLQALPDRKDELETVGEKARRHVLDTYTWDLSARRLMAALRGWEGDRLVKVAPRRAPAQYSLSVLIPTKNRAQELDKTLSAYLKQSLAPGKYELLLVNDHGRLSEVEKLAERYGEHLNIRLINNAGKGGPAAARNLAIERARGEIVLITGDDIVPDEAFLAEHLDGHRRFPEVETALVGRTHWHPDLPPSPFHDYIGGEGGQQFNYQGMAHGRKAHFNRFYTSNCSLKRTFLVEDEQLFSTHYRFAACEDIEFAYRLHLKGMELRYWEKAEGYHLHEMTPQSFTSRQYKVGQMLTLLALQHPSFMPSEHMGFVRALEYMRCRDHHPPMSRDSDASNTNIVDNILGHFERMLEMRRTLEDEKNTPVSSNDGQLLHNWFADSTGQIWKP